MRKQCEIYSRRHRNYRWHQRNAQRSLKAWGIKPKALSHAHLYGTKREPRLEKTGDLHSPSDVKVNLKSRYDNMSPFNSSLGASWPVFDRYSSLTIGITLALRTPLTLTEADIARFFPTLCNKSVHPGEHVFSWHLQRELLPSLKRVYNWNRQTGSESGKEGVISEQLELDKEVQHFESSKRENCLPQQWAHTEGTSCLALFLRRSEVHLLSLGTG